ncbi:MAG TPA: hypothetical protein VFP46_01150 [Candidatus Paceibacterota bacterium]|nr:hypothetical protein [Candidatus Paceibacterota bacterium]
MDTHARITRSWKLMRYSYGLVVLLAGLDKILGTNIIVFWPKYISPFVAAMLPMSQHTFLLLIGIIEVVVAVLVFTRFTVLASYISAVWLILISINLLMIGGYLDIAIRDILLAIGAIATAWLGETLGHTASGRDVAPQV